MVGLAAISLPVVRSGPARCRMRGLRRRLATRRAQMSALRATRRRPLRRLRRRRPHRRNAYAGRLCRSFRRAGPAAQVRRQIAGRALDRRATGRLCAGIRRRAGLDRPHSAVASASGRARLQSGMGNRTAARAAVGRRSHGHCVGAPSPYSQPARIRSGCAPGERPGGVCGASHGIAGRAARWTGRRCDDHRRHPARGRTGAQGARRSARHGAAGTSHAVTPGAVRVKLRSGF